MRLARALWPVPLWGLLALLLRPQHSASETLAAIGAILPPFLRNNFDEILKSASNSCELLPLEILYSRQYTTELPLTDVVEFTEGGSKRHRLMRAHQLVQVRPPEELVVYIPGWWNTPTDESSEALVEALLQKHRTVLVVDTRLSFNRGYVASASRVNPLAHLIYRFIRKLSDRQMPPASIHLIGFSLGAHVAGVTGKLVRRNLGTKVGKITALDPAKPCFTKAEEFRLGRSDAEFVQVVHSSAGLLGLEQAVGHVDVYVNGVLAKQPECLGRGITLECDHAQAWRRYAASVADRRALLAVRCQDWAQLAAGACQGQAMPLGHACGTAVRGLFLYRSAEDPDARDKRAPVPTERPFSLFDFRTWWR